MEMIELVRKDIDWMLEGKYETLMYGGAPLDIVRKVLGCWDRRVARVRGILATGSVRLGGEDAARWEKALCLYGRLPTVSELEEVREAWKMLEAELEEFL